MTIQNIPYNTPQQLMLKRIEEVAKQLNKKDEHIYFIGDSLFWNKLTSINEWDLKLQEKGIKAAYSPFVGEKHILHFRNGSFVQGYEIIYD